MLHDCYGFYIKENNDEKVYGKVFDLTQDEIWKIDMIVQKSIYTRVFYDEKNYYIYLRTIYTEKNINIHECIKCKDKYISKDEIKNGTTNSIIDVYTFFPGQFNNFNEYKSLNCKDKNILIKELDKIFKYEINDMISYKLKRYYLGNVQIIIYSDGIDDKRIVGYEMIDIYATIHKETNIGVIMLALPATNISVTEFLDQITRNDVYLEINNNPINLFVWLEKDFNYVKNGTNRSFMTIKDKPDNEDIMRYLLSAEAYNTSLVNGQLCGERLIKACTNNIAEFNFSEIYSYDTSVLQIYKDFEDTYMDRIYNECLAIFIIELFNRWNF